ncbi:MAG: DUF2264 domain-containing protein [Gemmatimonadota bacterium]|nr:DUF2264 domain-containing protein [Gemmatimonadota bacterium]
MIKRVDTGFGRARSISLGLPIIVLIIFVLIGLPSPAACEMQPEAVLRTPEDKGLSPYTGYTREHWLEICEKLIAGVLPYFDPETGIPTLKGMSGESAHFQQIGKAEYPIETFERSLMLVAIYTAATGRDTVPGWEGSITKPFLTGIRRGSDPEDPLQLPGWGAFASNIALAAMLSPDFFWKPFTNEEKKNLLICFKKYVKRPTWDCNTWFFRLTPVPILDRENIEVDRDHWTRIFRRCLNWYRGDGWFIDGGNLTFDYYNLWGFQLYNNMLIYFDPTWHGLFFDRIKHISALFQESFSYFYGRDGGPVPWGRSLSYRFASLSALGWSVLAGTNTIPPGRARRIASGCLKYFWEHGAMSENGLLEAGFHGPNSVVAEDYIRRGAPYWAAQGLICLAIPEDHPFWTAREEPMPADGSGGRIALPGAQMMLKVSPLDGEVRNYILGEPFEHEGMWQRGIKYFQHSYSSYLGWCALGEGGPDLGAGRTGISYNGTDWHFRTNPRPIKVDPFHSISEWDFKFLDIEPRFEDFGSVITHTLIGENGELHIFWHTSARPAYLWLGGYGISVPYGESPKENREENLIGLQAGRYRTVIKKVTGPRGRFESKLLEPRPGYTHSHLFGGKGVFPYWHSSKPVPPNTAVVVYVNGTRDRDLHFSEISVKKHRELLQVVFEGIDYEIKIPF